MTEEDQRIVVPGLRICAAEDDYISGYKNLPYISRYFEQFLNIIFQSGFAYLTFFKQDLEHTHFMDTFILPLLAF